MILDGVQNPFNVGSVLRSAAALGVDHIWLAGHVPTPSDTKVAKTALGSQRFVPWSATDDPLDAIAEARRGGYRVLGVELAVGSVPLPEAAPARDVCLVVGHEDRGLSKDALVACDQLVFIPQVGRIGSLNVATATAVAIYEVRRWEWAPTVTADEPPPA
nr:TrmH family RNA methyltransferase [Rhabdothermincola salaria]